MATIPLAQIDTFASQTFEGNQACVMQLDTILPEETLQKIAEDYNVADTAFIAPAEERAWNLRWFTPAVEVPLCGHATLAAGHYLYAIAGFGGDQIRFQTRKSGDLFVSRLEDGRLEMVFPVDELAYAETDA